MSEADSKAYAIIDACVKQLRELGGGEIPTRWNQRFSKEAREPKKQKCNSLHMLITAEYLIEWSRNNPVLLEPLGDLASIPDEEPAPRGVLQKLAVEYGMHHSSVKDIIERTLQTQLIEAQLAAIYLSSEDLFAGK